MYWQLLIFILEFPWKFIVFYECYLQRSMQTEEHFFLNNFNQYNINCTLNPLIRNQLLDQKYGFTKNMVSYLLLWPPPPLPYLYIFSFQNVYFLRNSIVILYFDCLYSKLFSFWYCIFVLIKLLKILLFSTSHADHNRIRNVTELTESGYGLRLRNTYLEKKKKLVPFATSPNIQYL
jgi:hypothetical protein